MSEAVADPLPERPMPERPMPAPPAAAKSTIETDTYCIECGFNLHMQPVWRDERLGILVARCPECGQHHAAGTRTTAPNAWLGRLAFFGLVVWVLLCLAFITASFFGLFGMQVATAEGLVNNSLETVDGQPVTWNYSGGGSTRPTFMVLGTGKAVADADIRRMQRVPSWMRGKSKADSDQFGRGEMPIAAFLFIAGMFSVGAALIGTVLAIACWFWPSRRRLLWLALPALSCLLALAAMWNNAERYNYFGVTIPFVGPRYDLWACGVVAALQVAVVGLFLGWGRPVARGVLRLALPPRARQYFGFLWLCDGKTPPLKP